ncbi:MAG: YgaP-like transmembrane domain [Rhizobacter sp.]
MNKVERLARAVAGAAMLTCAVAAPLPLAARVVFLGLPGLYMLATAAFSRCAMRSLMLRMVGRG